MKRGRKRIALVLAVVLLGVYACAAIQTTGAPASPSADLSVKPSPTTAWRGGETLSLVTWNLGYGGLGHRSDFFADGGKAYLPPSRRAVVESRDQIAAWLGASDADVILTQEIARASAVNLWVDLKGSVDAALGDYGHAFYADFRTRLAPPPLRIRNGLATYSRAGLSHAELWPLPEDGDPYAGALRRRYAALVTRIDGPGGCWTIVNAHLSAFDEGAALRRRQIQVLMSLAEAESQAGRRVLIGGDWNLRLVPTAFAHTTQAKDLFWVHDFPTELLPAGWRIAADASIASVRTNERPYRPGQNYTAVIDGYVLGPGVALERVQGIDLEFVPSDHQPVRLLARAEGAPLPACPVQAGEGA